MKKIAILLGFCLIMAMVPTFIPQPIYAMTGSGTPGDPYVIYNVTDLQNMANNLSAYYVLNCSIDASATVGWNGGAGFAPVGPFTGQLDGNNYTISELYINRTGTTEVGLFSNIDTGVVGNLTFYDCDVRGRHEVGILVGDVASATVTDVACVSCDVRGQTYVGGLIGRSAYDTVTGCSYQGFLRQYWYDWRGHSVGGLVGYAIASTYTRCYTNIIGSGGSMSEKYGGMFGSLETNNDVDQCYAVGSFSIVFDASGYKWRAGGFAGYIGAGTHVNDCYARVDVAVSPNGERIGGFSGQQAVDEFGYTGQINNCYSTGAVSGGPSYVGGFNGYRSSGIVDCFWDTQTSGQASSAGGTGKSTTEMKTEFTFTDAGWDFSTIWDIGGTVNDGYPYFLWWYNPPTLIDDVNQVVWFQPNAIILGTELPNRAQGGTLQDGEFHWGANPAGITISHGELIPEEEYDFVPISPSSEDIIQPNPDIMTGDVDTAGLTNNPFYALVHALGSEHPTRLTDRLVWLIFAWFVLIAAMLFVHIGFDTKKDTEKPQHFVLTTIVGLGLSILFYTMGIFPLWVVILMAFGLIGAIIYERQPVL